MALRPDIDWLALEDGRRIAVRQRAPRVPSRPTLLFLPGYASDMDGSKALAVDDFAAATGCGCVRFDYSGTGASPGNFADGTLHRWLDELLALIDRHTEGALLLVGSSMGGWLMLRAALRRPARIAGLVGIAAAPDFTDWGFSAEDQIKIERDGRLERANPYGTEPAVTHRDFWRSGQELRLLDAPIAIDCPVRLLHGDADRVVPVAVALRLLDRLTSADVQLLLIKGGDHRLSEPVQIAALLRTVAALMDAGDDPASAAGPSRGRSRPS